MFELFFYSYYEDILRAIDNNRSVDLVIFDLSAAFDLFNHRIFLHRLEFCFGETDRGKLNSSKSPQTCYKETERLDRFQLGQLATK